jgi:predicted dehydrogenase
MIVPCRFVLSCLLVGTVCIGCQQKDQGPDGDAGDSITLMTLDPGHFHAALVQKSMYEGVSPTVYVYAPEGSDVEDHLNRIQGFNDRAEDPTQWIEKLYTGPDFLEKMLSEKPGNVVVTSGNNAKKTDYIMEAVSHGLHVIADKPMVITPGKFPLLIEAFDTAKKNDVLLYDVMTERYEISTLLQKALSQIPEVFGQLNPGTPDSPGITKESVHHFSKTVAGKPIKRPAWFFDPDQRGEALSDVSTHLVDLVQWACFPEQVIDYQKDIEMIEARRWTTDLSLAQFSHVTRLDAFTPDLTPAVENGQLRVFSNGEMTYKLKGVCAKVSVAWRYEAPAGTGDTHHSLMRGTKSDLVIRQGQPGNEKPTLYIEAHASGLESAVNQAVLKTLQADYPGVALKPAGSNKWIVTIPDTYRVGHEAHFGQVMQKYLGFLKDKSMPAWEVPNMIAKYYTTTQALKLAREN